MNRNFALCAGMLLAVSILTSGTARGASAPPDLPSNLSPLDGATSVPVTTLLKWNTPITTAPLQVLVYAYGAYSSNMVGGIRQSYSNFVVTETVTVSTSTLTQLLVGKDLLLISTWSMGNPDVRDKMGLVIRQFVQNGGYVAVVNPYAGDLLQKAGLMDITYNAYSGTESLTVSCAPGDLTRGIPTSFSCAEPWPGVGVFRFNDETRTIVSCYSTSVVGFKRIGAGGALIMGWSFNSPHEYFARILANMFQYAAAHPGNATFDVYLDTTNPPTTKIGTTELPQFQPELLSFDTTYYWRIIARNNDGTTTGSVWSFRTAPLPPPAAPSSPSPADQSTVTTTLTPALTWNGGAIIPVSSYTVRFDSVNPPVTQVATGITQTTFTTATLVPGRTYYWQVISHNSVGDTSGPVWSFTAPPPPPAPHDPSPADNATTSSINVQLRWNTTNNDGDRYDVYFGTANPPTTKIGSSLMSTQCSPGPLNYSTTYYWRVVAHNQFDSTQGPVWSFRVDPPRPSIPSTPTPIDGTIGTSTTTMVSWSAGPYPAAFSVRFGTTNPPTKLVASGLATPSYTAKLSSNTTYYWQVTATNVSGSTVGPVWKFSTPLAPVSSYPSNAAANVPINSLLQWSALPACLATTGTAPLQILVYNGHCDTSAAPYMNVLSTIRGKFPTAVIATTNSESSATLAAQLSRKQVFIMPEQANWTADAMGAFGTKNGLVLKQFVQNGGLIIVTDKDPHFGYPQLLANAGLMTVTLNETQYSTTLYRSIANSFTGGVAIYFHPPTGYPSAIYYANMYSSVGDAQPLAAHTSYNLPAAACKQIGDGYVVLIGWNYVELETNLALLLTNPIQYGAPSSPLTYCDIYVGTTNPPTTKAPLGTFGTQYKPSLNYATTYYWRIVAHYPVGDISGPAWSFTTAARTGVEAGESKKYE